MCFSAIKKSEVNFGMLLNLEVHARTAHCTLKQTADVKAMHKSDLFFDHLLDKKYLNDIMFGRITVHITQHTVKVDKPQ